MRRLQELDAIRGIAALSVVLFHYTTKYNEIFTPKAMDLFEFNYGHFGVQLFFILSGFVIFMTINKVQSTSEFIYKRFIRLYPVFWICVIFTFTFTYFAQFERFERTFYEFLLSLTMIPEILQGRPIDGAYWSLIPELFFYTFIAIILKIKQLKNIEFICIAWLLLAFGIKIFNISKIVELLINADYCYLFIAGINFYKIYTKKATIYNHLIIVLCLIFSLFTNKLEVTSFATFFFLVFYLFSYNKLVFLGKIKVLVFLGFISYPLYLLHQFFGLIIINKLNNLGIENYFLLLTIPLALAIVLSWIITTYIEKPLLSKYKNLRLKPRAN